jgi:anti-sigma-K factor RskA
MTGNDRWRAITAVSTALAAGLAVVVVMDRLPASPESDTGRSLAVVNTDGAPPAFVVDLDVAGGVVTVRPVAADRPAGRDLELWAIPEGRAPVSLGIVNPADPVIRLRPDRPRSLPTRGAIAVSVEPVGGSPTGVPTGPVVYSGRLIAVVE